MKAVAAPKKVLKNKSVTGKKRLVLIPRKKSTSVPLPVLKSSDTNSKAKPKRKKTRSRQKKVFDYRNMKFKKYKSSPSPYGNAEAFSEAWWDINFRRSVQRLRNRTLDYGFVAAELKRLNRYSKMYPKLKKKHKIPSLQTVSSWYFKDFINRRNTTFNIKPIEDQVRLLRQFGRQGRVKGHLIRRYSAWRIVNWLRFELIHTQSPKEIRSLTRRYKKLIKNEKRFQYHVDRYTNTAKLLNLLGQSSGERQLRRALKGR